MTAERRTLLTGAAEPERPRMRLDRPVLVGNLISGTLWLVVLALLATWILALIGAAYVVVASMFLAAVYGRDSMSRRGELLAWAAPWLLAVALWAWIGSLVGGGSGGTSGLLLAVWFGLLIGTGCYLAWQSSALVVRQLMAWKARPAPDRR